MTTSLLVRRWAPRALGLGLIAGLLWLGGCKGEGNPCDEKTPCQEGMHCFDGVCETEETVTKLCRASPTCTELGRCTPKDGACVVGSAEDCTQSEGCETRKECTFDATTGRCVADTPAK